MIDTPDKVTKEDALKGLDNPMGTYLEAESIDGALLAKKLKEELDAEDLCVIKIKGAINQRDLPEGWEIIGDSGLVIHPKGDQSDIYGDGETLIAYKKKHLMISQKARQDAHKLRGDYPNEKLTLTHDLTEHTKKLLEEIDGQSRSILPSEED